MLYIWPQFGAPNTRGTPSNAIRVDPGRLCDKSWLNFTARRVRAQWQSRLPCGSYRPDSGICPTVCRHQPALTVYPRSILSDKVYAEIDSSSPSSTPRYLLPSVCACGAALWRRVHAFSSRGYDFVAGLWRPLQNTVTWCVPCLHCLLTR
ncbi:hypothetical protein DFH06DRAFT_517295 [Mycena polygramma]|nr:hypothetical protein DFH06DRAFT_517295 [Mycena polygramma]